MIHTCYISTQKVGEKKRISVLFSWQKWGSFVVDFGELFLKERVMWHTHRLENMNIYRNIDLLNDVER